MQILIYKALTQLGGKRSLRRTDKGYREPRIESYKGVSSAISTVAGLIIAASFAAAFAISNAYNGDRSSTGKAALARKPLIWFFVITDSLALFSSISVALLLFFAGIGDYDLLIAAVSISLKLMAISLISLTLTFLLGLSLVLSQWHAIVASLICLVVLYVALHWLCHWFPLLPLYFKFSFPNKLFSCLGLSGSNESHSNQRSRSVDTMKNEPTYQSPNIENEFTNQSPNNGNESTYQPSSWHSHETHNSNLLSKLFGKTMRASGI
ncbi:hypothetical protein MRB53_023589 [Persea americana]|uniref:Uncharacterized protein n=1 Tax=Persea americana TaxID=3435 RepID=A0ACC2L9T7_PERAE|nr:hypothetical protein MRB53_023589 [Persea americana]